MQFFAGWSDPATAPPVDVVADATTDPGHTFVVDSYGDYVPTQWYWDLPPGCPTLVQVNPPLWIDALPEYPTDYPNGFQFALSPSPYDPSRLRMIFTRTGVFIVVVTSAGQTTVNYVRVSAYPAATNVKYITADGKPVVGPCKPIATNRTSVDVSGTTGVLTNWPTTDKVNGAMASLFPTAPHIGSLADVQAKFPAGADIMMLSHGWNAVFSFNDNNWGAATDAATEKDSPVDNDRLSSGNVAQFLNAIQPVNNIYFGSCCTGNLDPYGRSLLKSLVATGKVGRACGTINQGNFNGDPVFRPDGSQATDPNGYLVYRKVEFQISRGSWVCESAPTNQTLKDVDSGDRCRSLGGAWGGDLNGVYYPNVCFCGDPINGNLLTDSRFHCSASGAVRFTAYPGNDALDKATCESACMGGYWMTLAAPLTTADSPGYTFTGGVCTCGGSATVPGVNTILYNRSQQCVGGAVSGNIVTGVQRCHAP